MPWVSRLVCDYCHDYNQLASYYSGSPPDPSKWHDLIIQRRSPKVDPKKITEIVENQLRSRGAPPAALAGIDKLRQPGTIAILTGQQAGLFGGPLYTLFKALTAVSLARKIESEHKVKTVPVFWVDAEDHDLDEIRKCTVLDRELTPHTLSVDFKKLKQPAASVTLPKSIENAVNELNQILPKTEFSSELLAKLTSTYSEGIGVVEAFSRWLDFVLGAQGLVVFDSSDPAAKSLVQPIFSHELLCRGETSRLASNAGKALTSLGYHAQVTPATDNVALFWLNDTRQAIRLNQDDFNVGNTTQQANVLLKEANNHPDKFSPSVLLRPIVQDFLFPTVAYVAGPNELAYLGQLRQVYEQFGVPMPLIYPRLSATIIDRATVKFLNKNNVPFESFQAKDDHAINSLLNSKLPNALTKAITLAEYEIAKRLNEIETEVPMLDSTLIGAVQTTQNRLKRDLGNLHSKLIQAAKRRDSTLQRQFQRVRAQTFPSGNPQERSIAGIYFLNQYGLGMVERLLEDLPLELGYHRLLTL
jgi:bacillithiol biosynthesis cysteine-adding enzyme BshC